MMRKIDTKKITIETMQSFFISTSAGSKSGGMENISQKKLTSDLLVLFLYIALNMFLKMAVPKRLIAATNDSIYSKDVMIIDRNST